MLYYLVTPLKAELLFPLPLPFILPSALAKFFFPEFEAFFERLGFLRLEEGRMEELEEEEEVEGESGREGGEVFMSLGNSRVEMCMLRGDDEVTSVRMVIYRER